MSDGWKAGQNLFHRTLLAITRGPIVNPNEGFIFTFVKLEKASEQISSYACWTI